MVLAILGGAVPDGRHLHLQHLERAARAKQRLDFGRLDVAAQVETESKS